jgi:UDP-2-acetamido-2-deoxy-ribo-hexuluronate aminotransferase
VADATPLPEGDKAAQLVMSLPMNPYLTEGDQVKIVNSVVKAISQ